jgi:multiple sugar transport system substrate-binding protein
VSWKNSGGPQFKAACCLYLSITLPGYPEFGKFHLHLEEKMKKLFLVLSVLVIAGMALAACQTATPAPTEEPAAPAAPAATEVPAPTAVPATEVPAAPALSGTIRVGSWDSADGLAPFNSAIASFEAAYPGVKVQLEDVPQGYGDKLLAEFASGTAPDVFQVGDGDVAKFAAQGVFEPLDPYIKGEKGTDPLDTSVFIQAVADIGKVGGTTYLLTKDSSPLVLYYNKTLFDAAGVAYPTDKWTWDDFKAAAEKLTVKDASGNVTQWGVQLPDSWGDPTWVRGILPIIYQNGGDIISPDGKKATGYLDSDQTIAALQWYADLITKDKVAPSKADVAALNGADLFQTGKVAMLWTGVWPLGGYIKDTTMNFGTTTLPAGSAGRANSICWAGFAVYSKSENKDAAWAFLRWIGADKGAEDFANYALTDVKAIADKQGKTTDPYYASVMSDLAVVHPLPDFTTMKYNDCLNTPFAAALDTYFTSGGDLKALLSDVATQADACLGQ